MKKQKTYPVKRIYVNLLAVDCTYNWVIMVAVVYYVVTWQFYNVDHSIDFL